MRNNHFAKLVKYMKNVFGIDKSLNRLTDSRVNPKYKTGQIILPLLLGLLLRIESMNELKYMLGENEFRNVFRRGTNLPQIDTIRDTLKVIDLDGLEVILTHTVKKAIKNKVFRDGTIDGYMVGAVDGTKFFGSKKKSCPKCLTSKDHFYHSGVVMSTVGNGPKLVVGFDTYKPGEDSVKKDEGELNAAKRLITDVTKTYADLFDVVVYDALACNSQWINHCLGLNLGIVVRAKKNKCVKKVKRKANKLGPVAAWQSEKDHAQILVFESQFMMTDVDRPLRFVKYLFKYENGRRYQIMVVTNCLGMRHRTLLKMIKSRWGIENSVFNNLKTECGLEHCYVHGGNAVEAVLCLIFIAANIMQLFLLRRLRNHYQTQKEMVRKLLKGLYLLKYDRKLVFSSG